MPDSDKNGEDKAEIKKSYISVNVTDKSSSMKEAESQQEN